MKKFFLIILLASFIFGGILPLVARAASATLYLSPSSGTHVIGNRFSVTVRVNTGGAAINAAQGAISFDNDVLQVTGISTGGSIFDLWTTQPTFNNGGGTINFAGGVPHPGYNGSAGTICTITFQTKKTGSGGVRFTSGFVLANDGKGTNILSTMGSGNYSVSPKAEAPKEKRVPAQPSQPKTGSEPPPKKEEPVERATYNEPKITSETHPEENKWFSGDKVKFSWGLPDGVEGVSLALNKEEESDPGPLSDGLFDSKEYPIEEDGHWFFHIKFQDDKERWGTMTHFRINSDNTPPKDLEVEVVQEENDWPILKFKTTDELSGIDRYELVIDDLQSEPTILLADNSNYRVENMEAGKHTAIVKAYDRANNEASASIDFTINTIAIPEIKNYTETLSSGKEFFISGTSLPKAVITVYLQKGNGEIKEYTAKVDNEGNWFLVLDENFSSGNYTAWVKAVNDKGLESRESPRINFQVSETTINKVGSFMIDYFTILVSLLFMMIVVIISLVFLVGMIRKKLKKETLEVKEVLRRNLSKARSLMEMEINSVKMNKDDRDILKEELAGKIEEAESGILKEIRDVEKILRYKK